MQDTPRPLPSPTADTERPRRALAIVSNGLTPYRVHFHQRVAREMPEVRLFSVLTHEDTSSPWSLDPPVEIGVVRFGAGESSREQTRVSRTAHEYRKGGRIIRWMKEQSVGAVVVLGYNDTGRLRVIRWCRRNNVPCFLFGDSNIKSERVAGVKAIVKKGIVGWVVRSCAGVMPCGTLGERYFRQYGARDGRIFYVPYEPDYDAIRNVDRDAVRRVADRYGLSRGRRHVLYSGRLAAVKRVDLLVDAFVAIADRRPDWSVVIAGDGPMRVELEARVPVAMKGRFVWTGFINDQAALRALYRAADALVLPSEYEPWAVVVNEAAGAGLAIVSSDVVGAAEELVRPGVNGWTFPTGDLAALMDRLLDVTDIANVDRYKAGSAQVLADWRRRADPVEGLRQALASVPNG